MFKGYFFDLDLSNKHKQIQMVSMLDTFRKKKKKFYPNAFNKI